MLFILFSLAVKNRPYAHNVLTKDSPAKKKDVLRSQNKVENSFCDVTNKAI